jgi:DNA-binding transcriptional ArsR family regulator
MRQFRLIERGVGNLAVGGEGDKGSPRRGNRHRSNQDLPLDLTKGIEPSLEAALGHRTRREILRVLAKVKGAALSPAQLVQNWSVDASVAAVSYHVKALVKNKAADVAAQDWRSGSTQCFYRSTVVADPRVNRILKAMASHDRSLAS